MKLISLLLFLLLSVSSAQTLEVIASHSILADVVANVAGDAAEVRSLMPLGADPHSFTPRPSDLVGLARADIIFINGAGFEEGLLEAIENAGDDMNIAVASTCVEMLGFSGHHDHGDHSHDEEHDHDHDEEHDHDHEHDDHSHEHDSAVAQLCEQHVGEMAALHGHAHGDHDHSEEHDHDHEHDEEHNHDHEHSDDHGHDHDHGHAAETLGMLYAAECDAGHDHSASHDGHNHGACDPHVWMEPHNVMYWTMFIRDTLIELDPDNAETYSANAAAYLETLDAFAHDVMRPLVETVPAENRLLITNHHALGYFAEAYDFEVIETVIPGTSTLAEPSAAGIARIIDLVREYDIPALFSETTVNDAVSQQIAEETGATLQTLYIGSLSSADEPASTYLDYMRYNVNTIVSALGGGQ